MVSSAPGRYLTANTYSHNKISDNASAVYGNVEIHNISSQAHGQAFFRIVDYEKHKDRNSKRVQDTCNWVFKTQKFRDWLRGQQGSILWVTAYPGCGKSVISRTLVEENCHLGTRDHLITYFFFADNREQRKVASALCSLLHQIFHHRPQLFKKHAQSALIEAGEHLKTELQPIWDLFLKVVTDPEAGSIICVLDGLDECKRGERHALLNKLRDEFDNRTIDRSENSSLRIFITSRPITDIKSSIDRFSSKHLYHIRDEDYPEDLSQDIDLVARKKIRDLKEQKRFSLGVEERILKKLLDNNKRTFLWITLVCRRLSKHIPLDGNEDNWVSCIDSMPGTVYDFYETFLKDCPDRPKALALLGIYICAKRPLNLPELSVALSIYLNIQGGKSTDNPSPLSEDAMRRTVNELCGFFLSVSKTQIFPFHQTVIDFLIQSDEDDTQQSPNGQWRNSLNERECHRTLAEICMRSLLAIKLKPKNEIGNNTQREDESYTNDLSGVWERFDFKSGVGPFLDYASVFWAEHFQAAECDSDDPLMELALQLCRVDSDCYDLWFRIYWWRATGRGSKIGRFTDLGVATFLDLESVVTRMLRDGADINENCGEFGFPLHTAGWKGNESMTRLLLGKNADINRVHDSHGNALYAALAGRKSDVVSLLLDHRINTNQRGGLYGTALVCGAVFGDEKIVKALLENGADITARHIKEENAKRNEETAYYPDPLTAAAWENKTSVVKLLLERGARVVSDEYGNPLYATCFNNEEELVHLFLEHSPDIVNDVGGELGFPLQAAAWKASTAIVKLLLTHNADVHARGGYFGTALQAASYRGSEEIVRLLLERGAR